MQTIGDESIMAVAMPVTMFVARGPTPARLRSGARRLTILAPGSGLLLLFRGPTPARLRSGARRLAILAPGSGLLLLFRAPPPLACAPALADSLSSRRAQGCCC